MLRLIKTLSYLVDNQTIANQENVWSCWVKHTWAIFKNFLVSQKVGKFFIIFKKGYYNSFIPNIKPLWIKRQCRKHLFWAKEEEPSCADGTHWCLWCWWWMVHFGLSNKIQHNYLPGNFRGLYVSICWQALYVDMQISFKARLNTSPQCLNYYQMVCWPCFKYDWPANLSDLNLTLSVICQKEDEKHPTQIYRQAEDHYQQQPGLQ